MSRTARLESAIAGGVLVAAAFIAGALPAGAQERPPTTTTPVEEQGGVDWGPVVESQPAPLEFHKQLRLPKPPKPQAPSPKPQAPSELEKCAKQLKAKGGGAPFVKCEPKRKKRKKTKLRNSDGSPALSNPGFMDALPGPSVTQGVPNFVIRKFRVPVFLLPIYQAAGIQYGIRWEVLAAINEIETDYGRNLNVSSAGALGWMQFMPATWKAYGVDANKDGRKDPYNPVDAIFAAARYLKAAGYEQDVRKAVFAYNHADWYVDSVLLRARLIAGVPADLVGSLTGLTEGRFPVAARARYADDLQEAQPGTAARERRGISIYADPGAPVVAVNDGQIKKIGRSKRLGLHVVLHDVYGNRYTYAHLGTTAKFHPVPRPSTQHSALRTQHSKRDPAPRTPASAGRQPDRRTKRRPAPAAPRASLPIKERLFAHPELARDAGGIEQLAAGRGDDDRYANWFVRPFGAGRRDVELRRLKVGSEVIGGTILGRVAKPAKGEGAHVVFEIRPAGRGAPKIDPKPILDGWKLLEATAIYRAKGENALRGPGAGLSIGQILLLSKPQLEKRVLADERIEIYAGGRADVESGQIDRRILATLEYLAEAGLRPSISSLKSGHGHFTTSGNVSEHSSGNAVDISRINGVSIAGHQDPGGVTDQAVRRLMRLQGTLRAHQIISLLDLGQNTVAMGDHDDHIHVGFKPLFGENRKLGAQALAVLKPGQWSDLIERLGKIDNPVVATSPSKYALRDRGD
jgi:hypothetical protein